MKLIVDVRWDAEASVWYAVSRDGTGLATESETLDGLRQSILAILPDLADLNDPAEVEVELIVHGISTASGPMAAE
ncbi:uncharacterized protein DUF1902 [Pseudaminobacter salicylatoxidans]|uniref:Uncharacterized protein DUF1902 n=1 Tax=Pseudaminobacter salicylatoxidans TaxID=93369 RepID=A0A316C0B8_PSESE|nr:DUF1902 domain-containing protein [Pseudaminobacter salicylatoxidans]PWJ78356.1 uncharacterized protein DUF1902 [Pseudaminobacter salicylatoxidans]